jgi:hypothetical protein
MHRWKRRDIATDSSVEQGLEDGRSPGGRLTLEPGNGGHGRAPRTPARERVRTRPLRRIGPAPLEPWSLSMMWGSASADRSLVEIQGTVLRLRFHFGGTRARFGLGCRMAVHPALPGSGRSRERLLRQAEQPVPRAQTASAARTLRPAGPPMPASVGTEYPPGTARTCFGRHRPSVEPREPASAGPRDPNPPAPTASAIDGDCFGSRRAGRAPHPPVPASAGTARRWEGTKRPHTRSTRRPPRWTTGREMGCASSSFGRRRFHIGFGRCERYLRGFRRLRPPARVAPVTLRPRRSPAITVVGGPLPPPFFGRRTVHVGRRKPVHAAKNANELVRDVLRKPGQPGG